MGDCKRGYYYVCDRVAIGQLNAKGHISGENSRKGRGKWQDVQCKVT